MAKPAAEAASSSIMSRVRCVTIINLPQAETGRRDWSCNRDTRPLLHADGLAFRRAVLARLHAVPMLLLGIEIAFLASFMTVDFAVAFRRCMIR